MNITQPIASFELAYDDNGLIVDERTGEGFDSETYSRMKYGDRHSTQIFADRLADTLTASLPELLGDETAPQFLVAYKEVPPACYYLSRYCLDKVNVMRFDQGLEPGRLTQVYKGRVAATNYAAASQAERLKELQGISFSMEGRDLSAAAAVVLDDIRITGSAERAIVEVAKAANPRTLALGYIAIFNADQAAVNPGVEHDLNASVVRGVADLLPAIQADNFDLNIRTLKLILASPEPELQAFAEQIPAGLLGDLISGTYGSGHDFAMQYGSGLQTLKSVMKGSK